MQLYLDCNLGVTGVNLLKLQQLRDRLAMSRLPFIIGADWNMTPDEPEESGWLRQVRVAVKVPAEVAVTCTSGRGRIIDYFVVSRDFEPLVIKTGAALDTPWGPHIGI